ncbi:MAG: lytic transglycosylase domain-containing protein [Psychrobacter sp.]|uniref:lytic transglycosylase domain-containing protein n=1 Tax=Psychrobacter sp. TaxID=56811 RepID=UPI003F9A263D
MINVTAMMTRYLSPLLLGTVASTLAFSTATHASNMYILKDENGQVLLTNVSKQSGNFEKFTKTVKVTSYASSKMYDGSGSNYGSSSASNSGNRNAYDSYIRASAARHGVDPALMKAMMHTESAFNPNARSPVGAQGLMQLMPATARRFKVSNPWNPAENIEGSAKYIAWLMRRFNNNVEHAIAGYNAGEGNVDKYGGIPPFKETRNYVQKVMSRYHSLYKNDAGLSTVSNTNNGLQNASYGTSSNSNNANYVKSAYDALR